MVSATFIFRKKQYDDTFFRLDESIEKSNSENKEFLGKDSWENSEKNLLCVVYYYKSMKGISDLRNVENHKSAKRDYSKWYEGYHVIISEITKSYGDGFIEHPTPSIDY